MDVIKKFDSLEDWFAFIDNCEQYAVTSSKAFFGRPYSEAREYVRRGAPEGEQRAARDIMDKMNIRFDGRQRVQWTAAVSGPRVNVPAYVTGHPLQAYRRTRQESRQAPVRVVVETLISAGVSRDAIDRRGAAIVALIAKLGETRPVELWASWGMRRYNDYIGMVKLESQPLNLSHLVATLATPEFSRSIMFSYLRAERQKHETSSIKWGWGLNPSDTNRVKRMRDTLGLAPQDIFIAGGHFNEHSQMVDDPVQWVENQVDAQRSI